MIVYLSTVYALALCCEVLFRAVCLIKQLNHAKAHTIEFKQLVLCLCRVLELETANLALADQLEELRKGSGAAGGTTAAAVTGTPPWATSEGAAAM